MKRSLTGFTLVELLVVITIAFILIGLSTVTAQWAVNKARNTRTSAFIKNLDSACQSYKIDFHIFPSDKKYVGSQNLHYFLGVTRWMAQQYDQDENPIGAEEHKPYLEFKRAELQGEPAQTYPSPPVPLVDAFSHVIEYESSNPQHNVNTVDIWSKGKNGVDDPAPDFGDDIGNWMPTE